MSHTCLYGALFGQPEYCETKKDPVASEIELSESSYVSDQKCPTDGSMAESPASVKSIGSYQNYCSAYLCVCKFVFDSCMQVLWNAVSYDPIVEYSTSWRKRIRWSSLTAAVGNVHLKSVSCFYSCCSFLLVLLNTCV